MFAPSARVPRPQLEAIPRRVLEVLCRSRGLRVVPLAAAADGGAAASAQREACVELLEQAGGVRYADLNKDTLHALCLQFDLLADAKRFGEADLALRLSGGGASAMPAAPAHPTFGGADVLGSVPCPQTSG